MRDDANDEAARAAAVRADRLAEYSGRPPRVRAFRYARPRASGGGWDGLTPAEASRRLVRLYDAGRFGPIFGADPDRA